MTGKKNHRQKLSERMLLHKTRVFLDNHWTEDMIMDELRLTYPETMRLIWFVKTERELLGLARH